MYNANKRDLSLHAMLSKNDAMIPSLFFALILGLLMGIFSPEEYFGSIRDDFHNKKRLYASLKIGAGLGSLVIFLGGVVVALNALGVNPFASPQPPPPSVTHTRQLCNGFFQTAYSNFGSPVESDIINLCNAGTLRPALGNIRLGGEDRGEKPYYSSSEILMVLNLISRNLGNLESQPSNLQVILKAISPTKPEDYLLFNAGTEHTITTGGRTFLVKLHEINREPTADGTPYYSYRFSVNEI